MRSINYLLSAAFLLTSFSCAHSQSRAERREQWRKARQERRATTDSSAKDFRHKRETIVYKRLPGVDPERLSLDVYHKEAYTRGRSRPVLIWVHGGSFHKGDKAQGIEAMRDWALRNGWVFVGVNYRLSPRPKLILSRMKPNRVKYPDHNDDIADAMKWVDGHIAKFGGNPSKLALIGHSAGAHLVSIMGTYRQFVTERGLDFSHLKAVVSVDIDTYDVRPFVEKKIPMLVNAFGRDPELNREASPIRQLTLGRQYPRFLVYTRGQDARKQRIGAFVDKLKSVKADVVSVDGSDYSHVGIAKAIGTERDMTEPLTQFLRQSFR